MKNLFPAWPTNRTLRGAALAFSLLAGSTAAHGQASAIYGLGITTRTFAVAGTTYPAGSQVLSRLNPTSPGLTALPLLITGIATGQQLVGLDVRPNTGQVYALGYNNTAGTSPNTQLYVLNVTASAVQAVAVGSAITLDLGTSARTDLDGFNLVVGVGFDFNPRADRIRVTGQNRTNYRLNPNTGALVATDAQLTYAATGNAVPPPTTPLIGAVAYNNSVAGLVGTTLYDVDQTPNNGIIATQSTVSAGAVTTGTLTARANLSLTGNDGPFGIGDATFDVDIFTNATTGQNSAYLLELTGPSANSKGSSNLYRLNENTGAATLAGNIIGGTGLRYTNIAAVLTPGPTVWTGAVSAEWNTAGNWSTNAVPTSTTDVFIPGPGPTVPNQPTVSDSQPQARSVILGAGTTGQPSVLTTASGGTLSVFGNFVNTDGSVAGSGTGTVALVGTTSQDISGTSPTTFRNLTINNTSTGGVTASSTISVERALTASSNLTIANNQVFTLLSNATTGVAYVVNNGGVVSGTATVRRYIDTSINAGFGYRHYSAPVTNTTLGDLATSTFSPVFNADYNTSTTPGTTTPYPTVYGYNQAQYESSPASSATPEFDKGYYSPASGSVAWAPGTGYTVNLNGSELVDFIGTLATGNFSTPPQSRSAKDKAGWQLLGNPYPSSLNWDQVAASGLSGIDNAVYVFKSTGKYSGSYAGYVNGQGTSGGTNVIPVAQGFFVRTSAGATGSLNFTNAQRIITDATAPFQRTAADTRPQLLLELSNGTTASQTDVYFESGATPAFDKAYDATALPFLNGLVLATQAGTEMLAINGQPALTGAVTVPLQVAVATAGTYTLRAATLANLPAGYHAYLRDAVLNTYTDLATTPSVALSLTTTPADGRYAVLFTAASPLATAPAALAALANVYPSPAHGTATLLLPQALRGTSSSTVQLLNSLGQVVLTRTLAAGGPDSIELPLAGLSAGIYVVRATTAAGLVAKRLVIQ